MCIYNSKLLQITYKAIIQNLSYLVDIKIIPIKLLILLSLHV